MHEKRGNFCISLLKIAEKEVENRPGLEDRLGSLALAQLRDCDIPIGTAAHQPVARSDLAQRLVLVRPAAVGDVTVRAGMGVCVAHSVEVNAASVEKATVCPFIPESSCSESSIFRREIERNIGLHKT